MAKLTRKAFLSYSALLAGAMSIPRMAWGRRTGFDAVLPDLPQSRGSGMEPDAIVVNARAHTMDAAAPDVDAFAIKDGRFQAVGRSADIRNMASARTQVFDAQQMTVLPGFTDCHCHPSGVGELYEANANVRTLAELQSNLRKKAAESPPGATRQRRAVKSVSSAVVAACSPTSTSPISSASRSNGSVV